MDEDMGTRPEADDSRACETRGGLWGSECSRLWLRYVDQTKNLLVLHLTPGGIILDCNQGFLKLAALGEKPHGDALNRFFPSLDLQFLKDLPEDFCQKIPLQLRSEISGLLNLNGYICRLAGNYLLLGERPTLLDNDLFSKMSQLHEELLSITRELAIQKAELERARTSLKILQGLLPICSACKKIRDDQGFWQQIEHYIAEHSEADFSHSICPECARQLYPQYLRKDPEAPQT